MWRQYWKFAKFISKSLASTVNFLQNRTSRILNSHKSIWKKNSFKIQRTKPKTSQQNRKSNSKEENKMKFKSKNWLNRIELSSNVNVHEKKLDYSPNIKKIIKKIPLWYCNWPKLSFHHIRVNILLLWPSGFLTMIIYFSRLDINSIIGHNCTSTYTLILYFIC